VLSGGFADPTVIYSGGTETISSGGSDDGAQISGGIQFDYGFASGVTVFTGSQVVESGGTASDTTVSSGGSLVVLSGGLADPAVIHFFGSETISAGGTAIDTTLFLGGREFVSAGGTDLGAQISEPCLIKLISTSTASPAASSSLPGRSSYLLAARWSTPRSAAAPSSCSPAASPVAR
jgi:autotransporter passenger strand-loop-strand repeat protein